MFDTIVKDGILVNGSGMFRSDIFIKEGKIEHIGSDDSSYKATNIIDASRMLIFPGIIDAHLHPVYADRIDTLSRAAASEGITTLIPYMGAVKAWGEEKALGAAIADFINEGEKTSIVDFGVHCTILQSDLDIIERVIPNLISKGIISFKVFMAYAKRGMKLEDNELIQVMKLVAANGGILAAHAENGAIIEYLTDMFIRKDRQKPQDYPYAQPPLCESEAIFRLLSLGRLTGCTIYVPHLSSGESLEVVRLFKKWGEPKFYVETCPHYLTLTEAELLNRGSIAKMAPPLRKQGDIDKLWEAVNTGLIDVIASDTAGHMKKSNEPLWDKIIDAPNGIPGLDTLFRIIYEEGVNKGRITLPCLVKLLCENPAKIFGLYPQKGVIKKGSDADIVVFDPSTNKVIKKKHSELNVDYNMYEGHKYLGEPVLVMQRGRTIFEHGKIIAEKGQGSFIYGKRRI